MDPSRFDALARVLSAPDSRRRVLGLLTAVPVAGGLLGILTPEESEAAGRRARRKKAHKHGKGRRRKHGKHKKKCTPDSRAQTCAGRCGRVINNCQQAVDCGSCACTPACAVCLTCQDQGANAPGTCIADPTQQGQTCGAAGQICQADGTCACDAGSCPDCTTCGGDGVCTPCAACCDSSGVCQNGDTDAACGSSGTCGTCASDSNCVSGTCTPGRYVFVTKLRYSGDLDGLGGADTTCTTVAGAAGLPGSYQAWLSDDTGSPSTRMSRSALPYYLVNGIKVAEDWAGLTSGNLLAPIGITEIGDQVRVTFTWTNTRPDGTLLDASDDCDNWTTGSTPDGPSGRLGGSYESNSRWTQMDELSCSFPAHLYCFQQS